MTVSPCHPPDAGFCPLGHGGWHDEFLYRTGAMNPVDVELLVKKFTEYGLEPVKTVKGKRQWNDLCVIDTYTGPTLPCDWVEYEPPHAWLKGHPKGEVVGPER